MPPPRQQAEPHHDTRGLPEITLIGIRRLAVRTAAAILRLPFRLANRFSRPRLIVYYVWPDFARKALAIADLLRQRGFEPVVRSGKTALRHIEINASRDLWIGFWNEYRTDYMPANYFFFNGEPLNQPHWKEDTNWIRGLQNALEVWDYSQANSAILAELGARFRLVPFGYAPYYETSYRANTVGKDLVEDIDVLFVGTLTERRKPVIERLRQLGAHVHTVTRDNPAHGAQLDELLARTRIVLAVFSYDEPDGHIADFSRLDHLLANRRFVVHEQLAPENADPGFEREVVTARYDDLADTCIRFLADPVERVRRAASAYNWFKSERALDSYIPYDDIRARLSRLS